MSDQPPHIEAWQTKRRKYVVRNRWMRVREDICMANGLELGPYYVLEYPDWVQIICVNQDGRICVARQYRHGQSAMVMELPCGTVEPGESARDAAERELREETGLVASNWKFLGAFSPNPATHTNKVHIFAATGIRKASEPVIDPGERLELEFVEPATLWSLINTGGFSQLLHLGALLRAVQAGVLEPPPSKGNRP